MNDILQLLSDGDWHTINEISALKPLRKVSVTKLMDVLNFLDEYGFIELSEKMVEEEIVDLLIVEAKLTPPLLEFMKKIKWIERTELVSKP